MKKILLAASLLLAGVTFANANNITAITVLSGDGVHIPASQVPVAVRASFHNMFPNATNVRWEREREHGQTVYEADFLLNGKRMKAEFAADGTYLGS